jgi:hypothetical protein
MVQGTQRNQRLLSLFEIGHKSGRFCHGNTTNSETVIFAKLDRAEIRPPALRITWQDVTIHLSNTQEARLAAELIISLRRPC